MVEQHAINDKDVWIRVDPFHVERENPNIIPTEYFLAYYFLQEPAALEQGETIKDEEGLPKLFESPVAALAYARKRLETILKK